MAVKNNIGPKAAIQAYYIIRQVARDRQDQPVETSVIDWDDADVSMSANEALRQSTSSNRESKLDLAKELLREELADNRRVERNELFELAAEQGISERTLTRAKDELGVRHKRREFQGAFEWYLPPPE